jgi:hypothetical protein
VKRVFEIEWDGTWNPDRDWEEIDLAAVKREARIEAVKEALKRLTEKETGPIAMEMEDMIAEAEEEGKQK